MFAQLLTTHASCALKQNIPEALNEENINKKAMPTIMKTEFNAALLQETPYYLGLPITDIIIDVTFKLFIALAIVGCIIFIICLICACACGHCMCLLCCKDKKESEETSSSSSSSSSDAKGRPAPPVIYVLPNGQVVPPPPGAPYGPPPVAPPPQPNPYQNNVVEPTEHQMP